MSSSPGEAFVRIDDFEIKMLLQRHANGFSILQERIQI